ncbi:MAG TPA: DNA ligase D [Stellaceae bacterium]|nr:DNA ligase D [Stellaceae bacterium]
MALEEYRRKRDFRKTPEPAGVAAPYEKTGAGLSFVIQKHAARRLHYDFRLELDGVLKSWAVPKGPSLDPGEKRLAVHVEDHPLDYGGFEGVIPEGEYGGGTVLLWDRGTWIPADPDPDAAYRKGSLKFVLNGEKLHGKWALVRMGGKASKERRENWLLIKERDDEALPQSGDAVVKDNPLSVATGRSLDTIAADRDWVWHSNRGDNEKPPVQTIAPQDIPGARKRRMPDKLQPQLATVANQAPDGPEWLHEIKYDGYRLLARIEDGRVRLITRGGLDWTAKFPALAGRLGQLPLESALIDGELVHLEPKGTTSFSSLQDAISGGETDTLNFFAFDLLYRDGWDLTGAALEDRKAALSGIISPQSQGMLRYSDHQIDQGPAFFARACSYKLEGIVSKRRTEPYRAGRGRSWLKVKCRNRDEFVVVGFTDPEGSREGFGALLVGYHDPQGKLRYAGRVGTGFNTTQLLELHRQLQSLARPNPTVALPKGISRKGVRWIEPRLVAEVEFADWTADAILRQASFQGLREDKDPKDVVYDPKTRAAVEPASNPKKTPSRANRPAPRKSETEEPQRARDGSLIFEGVRLTHPDRILYPGTNLTKLDVARYYAEIRDWILPELSRRLLTLVRSPAAGMKTFYQKHIGDEAPPAIKRFNIDGQKEPEIYPYIEDLPGLIGLVQMGVLEIHPWGSRVDKLELPDRVTMDLDPDEDLPWQRVTEAAIDVRDALAGIGLKSFAKTTGGKGLHVVIPLTPKLDWDQVKAFAKWLADSFVAQRPEEFTANMAKRARHGRIYIDYLRNGRGATAVGTYIPRARPGAPVSTPLFWEEVERGVEPHEFTVETVPQRLASLSSDPWAEIGKIRQTISAAVRRQVGIRS